MRSKVSLTAFALIAIIFASCNKNNNIVTPNQIEKFEVIINDIPYQTEKYLRVGYTLKIWEYEKEGLFLQKIIVLDDDTKEELMTIYKTDTLHILRDPIPSMPYFTWDKIFHYYLSVQLPLSLNKPKPVNISHRFEFYSTILNKVVFLEGAPFSPRINETPIAISSPVKGRNWLFLSQSTMEYHFYVLFFTNGEIWTGERYAFDNMQLDEGLNNFLNGDPLINESYYNYKDTLYAVANGIVVELQDNLPENNGNAQNVVINSINEYPGNYIILDIGGGYYACYAHCAPNSFFVGINNVVEEGDPIGLLGNSGNSGGPHLHFSINDRPDFLFSYGLPFVIKKYERINEFDRNYNLLNPPTAIFFNSMMEELTVIGFE